MSANKTTVGAADTAVDDLAAELTETAYPVLFRHGLVDNWLDLELDLWRALAAKVKTREQQWLRAIRK
jgi:hypothetical protein